MIEERCKIHPGCITRRQHGKAVTWMGMGDKNDCQFTLIFMPFPLIQLIKGHQSHQYKPELGQQSSQESTCQLI